MFKGFTKTSSRILDASVKLVAESGTIGRKAKRQNAKIVVDGPSSALDA
jgi:hypothetical protein